MSVSKRWKKENVLNYEPQKVGFLANFFAQPAPIRMPAEVAFDV